MIRKIIILLGLSISLTACYNPKLNIYGMPDVPKDGPVEYRMGWKDGCETGMTTYSNTYMRTKYSTNVNAPMMQNPHYNKGWELGQRYCSYYSATYLQNKEFHKNDLRGKDTWLNLTSDGFFSYGGSDKFGSNGQVNVVSWDNGSLFNWGNGENSLFNW